MTESEDIIGAHDMKAISITSRTMIGTWGDPPWTRGNCFRVMADDGNVYRIVNFIYENLHELEKAGLNWPIGIRVLSGRVAVIHDRRIPANWYSSSFCEVCCPKDLLPLPQVLRHEREAQEGT
jgi:hypothetical protein